MVTKTKEQVELTDRLVGGYWIFREIFSKDENGNWVPWEKYMDQQAAWGFMPDGKLMEYMDGIYQNATIYYLRDDASAIYIDCSTYEPDGFMSECYEESLPVELIDEHTAWFYCGDDNSDIKEKCDFRWRVEKVEELPVIERCE